MKTKRVILLMTALLLLFTLHVTRDTGAAFAADKGAAPVAHWRFDEGGGATAYDDSTNNNDGTMTPGAGGTNTAAGQMWTRQGKLSGAAEFDGTDDTISIPNVNNSYPFTVSLWATHNGSWDPGGGMDELLNMSIAGQRVSLGITDSWVSSGEITLMYGGTSHWGAPKPSATGSSDWNHIVWVVYGSNNSSHKIYVNGVSQTMTDNGGNHGGTAGWNIGSNSAGAEHWPGKIDDVRVYNYARTADQVMVDYNAGAAAYTGAGTDPNEGNPAILYMSFNENTGTTVYDRSGNGYDGTFTGSPSWEQGKYGWAANFDNNDYLNLASPYLDLGSTWTIVSWFKYPFPSGGCNTLTRGNAGDHQVIIDCGGTLLGTYDNVTSGGFKSSGFDTATLSPGWHHVGAVGTGGNTLFYIDGAYVGTAAYQSTSDIRSVGAYFGGDQPFGTIDEFKVYNYARTAAQVAYDYNKGKPVAHYRFDEGAGSIAHNAESSANQGGAPLAWLRMDNNWNDSSGNGYNATTYGSIAFSSSSKIGPYCGNFDGSDDYVTIDAALNQYNTPYTIEAWIYPETTIDTNKRAIVRGSSGDMGLTVVEEGGTDYVGDIIGGSSLVIKYAISPDNWYHVAVVNKLNGDYDLYVDGVLRDSTTSGQSMNRSNTLRIGGIGSAGYYFDGPIDDVRIYDYARTAEQIYNDYKNTHGTLVGNTKFVDGKLGKALELDGTGDYAVVDVDSWIRNCEYVTIAGWYYHNADTSGAPWGIMTDTGGGAGDGFWWHINYPGNALYLRTEDNVNGESDGTGTPFVSTGNWYHLATVIGTNTFKVYKDGALYWSWTPNNNFSWSNVNSDQARFFIGKSYEDDATGVNGKLDDVRLYNYARTAGQVMQDYNASLDMHAGVATGVADPWSGALPVGHWKLDENTGVLARDASDNSYDGTVNGNPAWTQGKNGPCLNFDGNDYVSCGNLGNMYTQGAISFWMKPSVVENHRNPFTTKYTGSNVGIRFEENDSGNFVAVIGNDSDTYAAPVYLSSGLQADTWYHVVLVWNQSTNNVKGYLNGVSKFDQSHTLWATTMPAVTIGHGFSASSERQWKGLIDDVRIYNYALTQAQASWLYNKGKPVAHWRMDEASDSSSADGDTVYDDSVHDNDGTGDDGANNTGLTWETGKFGGAIDFDGTDDFVSMGDPADGSLDFGTNDFSAGWWFKTTSQDKHMISKKADTTNAAGFHAYLDSPGWHLRVRLAGGSSNVAVSGSTANLQDDAWHHAAFVRSGDNLYVYVDGKQDNSTTGVNNLDVSSATSLYIGRLGSIYYSGRIDDARIYNYARTAAQVMQDYNQGLSTKLSD